MKRPLLEDAPPVADAEAPEVLETTEEQARRYALASILARLQPFWPWIVLAALSWLGWHELRQIELATVRSIIHETDPDLILTLLAATCLNLIVFGLYDVAALGSTSRSPRPGARWSVGVVSFAWSNFLTVGPLAGPALRLWLYKPLGVDSLRARSALAAILLAFSFVLLALCGAVSLPLPLTVDGPAARLVLAVPFVALAAVALAALRRLPIAPASLRRWDGSVIAMIAVATVDWTLAWLVFHLAMNETLGGVSIGVSLSAFFLGQLIGLASFIPGGLGSADTYWVISLTQAGASKDRVVAALLLYRAIYYVLPWAFATLILAGRLVRTGRRTGAFLRTAMASYTFLCGAVLLASAATPALAERARFLTRTVPLALIDVSYGLSIALGFMLLVASRGLARGYRSSHRVALALFLAGALTTFLKGFDFEEALFSLSAAALLLVFQQSFTKKGGLRPPVEFTVSVGLFAVVFFGAIGYGSLSELPHTSPHLQRLEYQPHEERFLKGLFGLSAVAAVAALHFGLRARAQDPLPSPRQIEAALREIRSFGRGTNPFLVAAGDKALFRARSIAPGGGSAAAAGNEGPRSDQGFIAYRTSGRFVIAYSDPVCPPGREREILAAFLESVAASDRDAILYQISAPFLPVAHDFGFTFFKLGEEAIVDLTRFDLKGNKAKTWRHSVNNAEKAGARFEILPAEDVNALMPQLREISDDWLAHKHVVEKRFSLGRFDEAYLTRFPCAIVRDSASRIVGFANVLEGPRGEEISVDLMRYRAADRERGGIPDVMDYLFIRLMLHGKEKGFARFNLGMAPLSSVGEEKWARPLERLANLFFRHGGHWYNYQGLRRYKEKFDPVWEPRYMAYPHPWDWPFATTSTAVLIAGGWRALFFPKSEAI